MTPKNNADNTSCTWWWIRHAPVRGMDGVVYGAMDVDADCSDGAQFDAVRRALPDHAVWFCSPMKRAVQTLRALRQAGDDGHRIIDSFGEQNFGSWQGQSYQDIPWPETGDLAAVCPPDGESFHDLVARASTAIEHLAKEAGGHKIIVAHAGTIRAALAIALDRSDNAALQFDIAPLSLTRLTSFGNGGWRVDGVNRVFD